MTASYVDIAVDCSVPGVLVATLNRPDRRNALTDEMFDDLARLQSEVEAASDVRAVIITGEGRGFCAGLDLDIAATLPGLSVEEFLLAQERWSAALVGFSALSVPVICAINGPAAGAGFALALACDIRVASVSAKFNAAFVRVGLSAGDCGASWFLPRIVGLGRATEIMLTGRFVDSAEALAIGLVSDVVADGAVLDRALATAAAISANSPFSMRMSKQVIVANSAASSLGAAVALENRTQVLASRTEDMREALTAFREKRAPEFSGRGARA
ncbi:enoyl-CoA hydratase/isomerase family protein [Cryobacterium aureum]|uniref:enoyl-CoA hydratase/isomerase family protein n=1 Tax=Cryobacterium aureum TaxID=995037 RepID=UPI000CF559A5|nr:enoyl-CoA hydratase-related protein [Cryobacterium aureum]